jgi:hypothetical protein
MFCFGISKEFQPYKAALDVENMVDHVPKMKENFS